MPDDREPAAPDLVERLGPFRHPAYGLYWFGTFVSNLGTWLQAVAGSIFIYQLTSSSFAVGFYNFAGFAPLLLFSVWGGQISDRFDRRRIVVVTHALSLGAAALLAVLTLGGVAGEAHLIVIAFVLNTMWALGKPSLVSLIPNIVPREDLQDAVGLNSLAFVAGQIVGPIAAAAVMAFAGAGLAFLINALTYLGPISSMVYLYRLGLGGPGTAAARRAGGAEAASASVLAFVRGHVWVPALLVGVGTVAAVTEILRTLAPGLVAEVLLAPESAVGLLIAAQSTGAAVALLLFVPIRRRGWSRRAALAGYVFEGVGIVTLASTGSLAVACGGVALIGFGFSLCLPVLTAVLQEETPDSMRGRVMALHQMAHLGNRPFTALMAGGIAGALGPRAGVIAGLLLVPIGLIAVRAAWRALPGGDETPAGAGGPTLAAAPD